MNQDRNALSAEADIASSQVAWLGGGGDWAGCGSLGFSAHLLQLTEQRWACVPGVFCKRYFSSPTPRG